ncbi:MAG: ABC transporter ATP-binding protein [Anaerolineales bacterium]|uniref:ABC transporter ATP-binding protein n=1 Tax=Candidatus Villigracilis affinis TaxID=3140682 RepID=UPI001D8E3BBA|nr:ABC transporter ATP-binding protein [Anaerolineales bacterium]MBK9601126.1 ABC transporter ATP-binding protein [Anaerolineales bacterium]
MTESTKLPSGKPRIETIEMRGITKRFPGVIANDKADFDIHAGEVHALLGENGAGKSTLMKILYGMYRPDEGEILLNGKPVTIASPNDSINLGIGMIHQHFMLVPTLTVAENVALGLPSSRGALTDLDRVSKRIVELASIYGLKIDPSAYVWQLSVGQQQRVEIIKALYRGAALLILDEPTAVLTPQEVDELFVIMRQMVKDGHALIFISHKLHEVVEISNRITVLRDGRRIGTRLTSETTKQDLANWMVGREIGFAPDRGKVEIGEARLKLEKVECGSDRGTPGLRGVSIEVRSGEILGIAGVSGNGQRELAEAITGLRKVTTGRVFLEGKDITNFAPGDITELNLSYIPEERMRDGMIKDFTIAENMILREHHKMPYSRMGFLNLSDISKHADELIAKFHVKTPSRETHAKNLSGGNIQKVVLAREISRNPRAIIAAQPTRGLDIGATEYVREQLLIERRKGVAVMLISEDLDEILALSDRIAVLYEGQVMDIVPRSEATPERLGLLMAGVHPEVSS